MAVASDVPVFGIDLGTTNSCIAVWKDGGVKILPNELGENTTPSCVAFTQEGILVGSAALAQQSTNPANTILEIKRIIGQNFDTVAKDMKYLHITKAENGQSKYSVRLEGETKLFHPVEISAIILKHLKKYAERIVQQEVKNVVLAVPAYFNDTQRAMTKAAGEVAGLNVLKLISEPVAAALAVRCTNEEQNILVYDLGGGTFDIAIVSISELGMYHVRATNGNTRLGGAKFDDILVKNCIVKLNDMGLSTEFTKDEMSIIRSACEQGKKDLSTQENTEICISNRKIAISRNEYNQMIDSYIKLTMEYVQNALEDAELEKDEINKIVLIGGSTYTPLIHTTLHTFFGIPVQIDINPMEAVAYGACVQSAVLSQKHDAPSIYVRNVIPLSIRMLQSNPKYDPCALLLKRNTPYPIKKTVQGRTSRDNQSRVEIKLFEGEHPDTKNNNILGTLVLQNLALSPKGEEIIDTTIEINASGLISATAIDRRTKQHQHITIERPQLLTEKSIVRMADTVAHLREAVDKKCVAKNDLKLESIVLMMKRVKNEEDINDQDEVCPVYGHCVKNIEVDLDELQLEEMYPEGVND